MSTRHLDLGCGATPRNPYGHDETHAVDIAVPARLEATLFRRANLALEPIPHADSGFDSVSAFDFLEHMPRLLATADGGSTRLPFIELMNEIWRVLKPQGRFFAITPCYPHPSAFQDPTHVNIITEKTHEYFVGANPMGRIYGFHGAFDLVRAHWALLPIDFDARPRAVSWQETLRRRRHLRQGKASHFLWEFAAVKDGVAPHG
jgi:SAM-dependent methyltransferase